MTAGQQPQPGDVWALADGSGYLTVQPVHGRGERVVINCRSHLGEQAIYDAETMLPGAILVLRDGKPVPQQEAS